MPKKTKIVLANPLLTTGNLHVREGRCQHGVKGRYSALWPQITLAYVAGVIEKNGWKVKLFDCVALNMDVIKFLNNIKTDKPDLILLNTSTPSIDDDLKTSKIIKETLPTTKICLYGTHVTSLHEEIIRSNPFIDIIIRGEPEFTVLELMEKIENSEDYTKTNGTTILAGEQIFVNPARPPIENLDMLPFPARHCLPNEKYRHPLSNGVFTIVQTARGCPYKCTFCVTKDYEGGKYRSRSVSNVLMEIEEVVYKYGIKNIYFFADTFTLNRDFVEKLCNGLIKYNIKWWANSRVNLVDYDLLKLMKDSGCIMLSFGVESGVQEILNRVNKGITLDETIRAFELCKKVGIETTAFVILGLLGDNKQTINETINFIKNLEPDYVTFFPAIPFPGTQIAKEFEELGLITSKNYNNYEGWSGPVVKTQDMSSEELSRCVQRAYRSIYLSPAFIINKIAKTRSISELYRLMKTGIPFAYNMFKIQ